MNLCRRAYRLSSVIWPNVRSFSSEKPSLKQQMCRNIEFTGPMNVHTFMKLALTHPQHGFYMKQDVFGAQGHFTTSPEVSQVFGELLAVWAVHEHSKAHSKLPLRIVELGPGRGTLTNDIARVCDRFKDEQTGRTSFHLVEVSPFLIDKQRETICKPNEPNITHFGQSIQWYSSLAEVPQDSDAFTVYLSNELLDALPVFKFTKHGDRWHEMLVDKDPEKADTLRWIRAKNETPAQKIFLPKDQPGDNYEVSPEVEKTITELCERLSTGPGCSLICDYGFDTAKAPDARRDTLRAYKRHEQADPLDEPGSADLTVDVDFDHVRRIATRLGCKVYGASTQATFLKNLGIGYRLQSLLMSNPDAKVRKELLSGVRMLMEDMGERFKFMAIYPPAHNQAITPTGFEEGSDEKEAITATKM